VLVDESQRCLIRAGADWNTWWADAIARCSGKRLLHDAVLKRVIRKNDNATTDAQCGNRCGQSRAQGGELIVDGNTQRLEDARCWMNS
jgi:outer membrane receptor for monomeric catechols